jgi:glycosyltransferase involved in cell wall biosynthesis
MARALRRLGPVQVLSWRRLYPPFLHRRDTHDRASRPLRLQDADVLLDWVDPRTWKLSLRRMARTDTQAMVLPWVHPVMAPPYRYLLRHAPGGVARIVICHNVEPHESVPFARLLTRQTLRHADVLVVHASHQVEELVQLGVTGKPIVHAFHPRFVADELCLRQPTSEEVARERARQGNPDLSLLAFGAIRPYKGIDLAVEALARVDPGVNVRLTVAGVFWDGAEELRRRVGALGLEDRVELRDRFVPNEEAALLFSATHASILPYRSASQSGVVQLSFAYGVPVIATSVGGLTEAVRHGHDGLICPPADVAALTAAIERMAADHAHLADGVRRAGEEHSFRRYGELLHGALQTVCS